MPKSNAYGTETLGRIGGKVQVLLPGRRRQKTTPYDRPHSSSTSPGSIASRLARTCSSAVASTASYVFSSLFGRFKNLRIAGGKCEDMAQDAMEPSSKCKNSPRVPEKRQNFGEVEEILKRRTLSSLFASNMDEADRLSDLLRTQAAEHISTMERCGEAIESESALSLISEAQKWREELKKARVDASTPVQIAQDFMGGRSSLMTPLSSRGVYRQIEKVAPEIQLQSASRFLGYRNHRPSAHMVIGPSVRTLEGSIVDEGWMSVGRVRRARESVFQGVSPSPYSRETRPNIISPPIQSSHTARKILDTLEKLSSSPKGKLLDGEYMINGEGAPKIKKLEHMKYLPETPGLSDKHDFGSMGKTPMRMNFSNPNGSLLREASSTGKTIEADTTKDQIMNISSSANSNPFLLPDNMKSFSARANGNPFAVTSVSNQSGFAAVSKVESTMKENRPLFSPYKTISTMGTSSMLASSSITFSTRKEGLAEHSEGGKEAQTSFQSNLFSLGSSSSGSSFSSKVENNVSPFSMIGVQADGSTPSLPLLETSNSNPSSFSASLNIDGGPPISNAVNTSKKVESSLETASLFTCAPSSEVISVKSMGTPSQDPKFTFASGTSSLPTFSGQIGTSPLSFGSSLRTTGGTFEIGGIPSSITNGSEKNNRKIVKPKRRR